jgi:hypothetical protein
LTFVAFTTGVQRAYSAATKRAVSSGGRNSGSLAVSISRCLMAG